MRLWFQADNDLDQRIVTAVKRLEPTIDFQTAPYEDMFEARERIGHFLEEVYNRKQLHSALGYVPSAEFEQSLLSANTP